MKSFRMIKKMMSVALLASCIQIVNAQTQVFRDVVFAEAPTASGKTKSLKINVWKGEGEGPQPVVLFVHGGAWVSGDNKLDGNGSEQIQAIMALRKSGVTVAAATYRFSFEAIFPAQIHDVKAAIRHLKANAEKYGIDPSRIMTMGESAGSQLALLAAVSNGEEAMEGKIGGNLHVDSNVIGCIDCYGMTDFLTLASDLYARPDLGRTDAQVYELVEDKTSSRSQLFGLTTDECNLGTVTANPDKFPEQIALVKAGSPLYHVTPDDPPVLIINGQRDIRVPSAQAIKMYQALYDAGVDAELLLNDRAPHGNLGSESAAAIQAFVHRILFPKNKPYMKDLRNALVETLDKMAEKAKSMNMQGVAVASILPKETKVDWIGEMKVVDTPYNAEGGDKGWNLVAIAWSKAGEVIASGADSGDPDRKCMMGELNFTGGAYDETENYQYAFAFSGGLSEDDLLVAKYGIEYLKSLLKEK